MAFNPMGVIDIAVVRKLWLRAERPSCSVVGVSGFTSLGTVNDGGVHRNELYRHARYQY